MNAALRDFPNVDHRGTEPEVLHHPYADCRMIELRRDFNRAA